MDLDTFMTGISIGTLLAYGGLETISMIQLRKAALELDAGNDSGLYRAHGVPLVGPLSISAYLSSYLPALKKYSTTTDKS